MRFMIAAGEFFFDLIYYKLDRLPRMGEEVVTRNFGLAVGGGAPTTAIVASRLGRKVKLAAVLGDSPLDDFAAGQLKHDGVATELLLRQRASMGAVTVSVSMKKDRYFLTYPGANVFLEKYLLAPSTRKRLAGAAHVHFGLSTRQWRRYADLVLWLKKQGVTTSWDLGWHPEAVRLPGFRDLYAALDVIFLNRIEALQYAQETSPEKAMKKLACPRQLMVVKLGPKGSLALGPEGFARAAGLEVNAVDTTGAGDAFNGGFLHYWLNGERLDECLRAGNACGALSTTRPGGHAGTPDQTRLARILRKMK